MRQGTRKDLSDLDRRQVRRVRYAANPRLSSIKRNVCCSALDRNVVHQGVVVRRIVHHKRQDLDRSKFGQIVVAIIKFYPSFETVHLDALPHLFRHIFAGVLSYHFPEIDE